MDFFSGKIEPVQFFNAFRAFVLSGRKENMERVQSFQLRPKGSDFIFYLTLNRILNIETLIIEQYTYRRSNIPLLTIIARENGQFNIQLAPTLSQRRFDALYEFFLDIQYRAY